MCHDELPEFLVRFIEFAVENVFLLEKVLKENLNEIHFLCGNDCEYDCGVFIEIRGIYIPILRCNNQ